MSWKRYKLKKATHVIIFEATPTAVIPIIFQSKKVKSDLNISQKKPTYYNCFYVMVSTKKKLN